MANGKNEMDKREKEVDGKPYRPSELIKKHARQKFLFSDLGSQQKSLAPAILRNQVSNLLRNAQSDTGPRHDLLYLR
jgi:hypothetical protein